MWLEWGKQYLGRKLLGKKVHFDDREDNGRLILWWILVEQLVRIKGRCNWFAIGSRGGP